MGSDIAKAERRLADAHQAAERKPRSFAIIPYKGPNGTYRRPIYLECRADAVILQPEGLRFTENDFQGPLDSDNPLATAVAAVNAYLRGQKGFDPKRDGDPYPLLLVRPSGILGYFVARAALGASYTEFGYELIGEDWPLHFPPPDNAMAKAIAGELDLARLRHKKEQELASLSSRSKRPKSVYRVSASGEMVREGRAADDGQGGWESGQQTADRQPPTASSQPTIADRRQATSGSGYPSGVGGAAGTGLPSVASGPGVAGGPSGGATMGGAGVGGTAGGGGPGGMGSGMAGGVGGGTGVGGAGAFGGIGGGTGSGMAGGVGGGTGVGGMGAGGMGFGGVGGGTGSGMAGGVGGGTGVDGVGAGGTGFGGIGGGTGSGMGGGVGGGTGVGGMGAGGVGGGGSGTVDMSVGGLSGMSGVQNGSGSAGGFNAAGGLGSGTPSGSSGGTSGYAQGMGGTASFANRRQPGIHGCHGSYFPGCEQLRRLGDDQPVQGTAGRICDRRTGRRRVQCTHAIAGKSRSQACRRDPGSGFRRNPIGPQAKISPTTRKIKMMERRGAWPKIGVRTGGSATTADRPSP